LNEITVSTKGQIVLPKELRQKYGLTPGTKLTVQDDHGRLVIEKRDSIEDQFPRISTEEFLSQTIKIDQPFPNDQEMEQAILEEAGRRFDAETRR
jgi:AbrB family looped-hinge helix DNA binding protein